MTELGKFGHHPDALIDAEIQIDLLEGLLKEARNGLERALDYRAITPSGVAIKQDVKHALSRTNYQYPPTPVPKWEALAKNHGWKQSPSNVKRPGTWWREARNDEDRRPPIFETAQEACEFDKLFWLDDKKTAVFNVNKDAINCLQELCALIMSAPKFLDPAGMPEVALVRRTALCRALNLMEMCEMSKRKLIVPPDHIAAEMFPDEVIIQQKLPTE